MCCYKFLFVIGVLHRHNAHRQRALYAASLPQLLSLAQVFQEEAAEAGLPAGADGARGREL